MKTKTRQLRLGFSLVEVTLALGIASIALLSVVGLLGTAMETSGTAGQDTALAAMAGQVLGDLRAAPFDALGQASPRAPLSKYEPLPEALADSTYYFTAEGTPLPGPGADAHFECVVRKTADASSRSVSSSTVNLIHTVLTFSWPVSANLDPQKRSGISIFNASIARY